MNTAFILAAGLGTRLRPWTLSHPKALVPVAGVPMLERVICKLKGEGFDRIVINVHHFANQIVDFVAAHDFGIETLISDESDVLLDTGGGLLHAFSMLTGQPGTDSVCCSPMGKGAFLVHNVDILSDAPLAKIMSLHEASGRDISLVTSGRESSRKLVFNADGGLCGWHNLTTNEYRPESFRPADDLNEHAFSGIYVVSNSVLPALRAYAERIGKEKFPIMDFFLDSIGKLKIGEIYLTDLQLIDIGKPETLTIAQLQTWCRTDADDPRL